VTLTYSAEPTFDELPEYEDEPRRRLSILRLLVAMVVLGASGWGVFLLVRNRIQDIGTVRGTWFAPYVDLTLTPTSQFQIPANNVARQSVLSFVVADAGTSCTPSWGGVYTLAAADQSLNLASRLAQLRSEGAFPIVSFGGQKNQSLQVACSDQSALNAAFASVVNRYGQTWDIPNLFVIGSSTFPSMSGFNPTLTIQALAYMSADAIVNKYKKSPGALL